MARNFEGSVELFCKKLGLAFYWQDLKFGFRRCVIPCDSHGIYEMVFAAAQKRKNWDVGSWSCYLGSFEGNVYIMSTTDKEAFTKQQEDEKNRIESWWMRYHNADEETRRLMACGAIQ